jgi:hypothetical protein
MKITMIDLERVSKELPLLQKYGFKDKRNCEHDDSILDEKYFLSEVQNCIDYLEKMKFEKFIQSEKDNAVSSYFFKHVVERDYNNYIFNGAFIAAAFLYGVKVEYHDCINVYFELTAKDRKKIMKDFYGD